MKFLTPAMVEGFVEVFLRGRFDNPAEIPDFHRTIWAMACSPERRVAFAAPRAHAKSTSLTHSYLLACLLFGVRDFALIISDTETQAIQFLNDIKVELKENDELIKEFGVKKFLRDTETDISVSCHAGKFRIIAKGSEQKVRGLKWRNRRPNLVICDDFENDEQVLNRERRRKFQKWFQNALMPVGSDDCIFRVAGTILHEDSMLERLLTDKMWVSHRFRAHNEDFTELLWPERFPKERLLEIRAQYASQGNLDGYSQEYLNTPIEADNAFFKNEWFVPMNESDFVSPKRYFISADLAVSQAQYADYTCFVVGGVDENNIIHIVECQYGRWDSMQTTDKLFALVREYEPEDIYIEQGAIEKSIGPLINGEMIKRNYYFNITTISSTKDKMSRAQTIKARMKVGGVKFDVNSNWIDDLKDEMMKFPRGKHDDKVDAMSLLGLKLQDLLSSSTPEEILEEEYQYERRTHLPQGRSVITGY